jgi:hypothetical protein
MNPPSTLAITKESYEKLRSHLFPGDDLEAAAILLCSRSPGPRLRLIVRDVLLVPHERCQRERDYLQWPGLVIEDAIDAAIADDLCLILLHSHPAGYFKFSPLDDRSDQITIPCIFQALGPLHGSAIMIPTGEILARVYRPDMAPELLDLVTVADDDIKLWWSDGAYKKRPMAFSSETRREMSRLSAVVIGASGTGSITIEQIARLGFGRIYMIDFDKVETKNLNRILNAGTADVDEFKVHVLSRAIAWHRADGIAVPVPTTILDRDAVLQASQADFIFSCVDSKEGRQIADLVASAFLLPLFDVGVSIPTRRAGTDLAVLDVCARIDYVRPGGPTLADRNVYTQDGLRAEYLKRSHPERYEKEVADGYIKGSPEQAPSVISLNMRASADLLLEFIARVYPFRHDKNGKYTRRQLSFAAGEEDFIPESAFPIALNPLLGRGDKEPLIGLPALLKSQIPS